MAEIGNEVTQRIRAAICTKLKELGTYVDDELPDYVMVMIANKKSRNAMKQDLALFLGDKTESFTDWLHEVLEHLHRYATETRANLDVSSAAASLIANTMLGKVTSNLKTEDVKTEEPDNEEDVLKLADQDGAEEFDGPTEPAANNSVPSEPNVTSTSSASSKKSSDVETQHKSSSDLIVSANRSDVRKRLSSAVVPVVRREMSPPSPPHRPQVASRVQVTSSHGDSSRSSNKHHSTTSMHSVAVQPSQPKRPRVNSETVLKNKVFAKALSEASHSSSSSSRRNSSSVSSGRCESRSHRVSARSRLGKYLNGDVPSKRDEGAPKVEPHFVVTLEGVSAGMFSTQQDGDEEVAREDEKQRLLSQQQVFPIVINSPPAMSTAAVAGTTTVIQAAPPPTSGCAPPPAAVRGIWSRIGARVDAPPPTDHSTHKRIIMDDEDEEMNPADSSSENLDERKKSERCRFFPNCTAGQDCVYFHPTAPCRDFPDCTLGDGCDFIHPVCRFNEMCTKPKCPYTHTRPKKPPVVVKSALTGSLPPHCKFFPHCTNLKCSYFHPKPCKFGAMCQSNSCPYIHPQIPNRKQLKWISPSS